MADSTVGRLSTIVNTASSGMVLRTDGNADYSRGGRLVGVKLHNGQTYHIAGTTKNNGVAASREVYLIRADNPEVILEKQTTGTDGLFDFKYLLAGNYTVFASNPDGSQDDVIHANIAAVEM
jgi:hypothetical protein